MIVLENEIFHSLDSSLTNIVPAEQAVIDGAWSTSPRRVYKSAKQTGSGCGPYADVSDARWKGTLTCSREIGVIVFLAEGSDTIRWAKSASIAASLPIEVSLHAYADHRNEFVTFTAGIADAWLPGITVKSDGDLTKSCLFGPRELRTGRVTSVAQMSDAAFAFIAFPRETLKMGRHRLWRLREELSAPLPAAVRRLLTRSRTGVIGTKVGAAL